MAPSSLVSDCTPRLYACWPSLRTLLTCIFQQVGGAVFVELGSSLDVMNKITFLGNSLAIEYGPGIWVRMKLTSGSSVQSDHAFTNPKILSHNPV